MNNNSYVKWVMVLVALIGIYILVSAIMRSDAGPKLSDFMASTTDNMASTTDASAQNSNQDAPVIPVSIEQSDLATKPLKSLKAPKGNISVYEATDTAMEEKGLGGLISMPEDRGMIFDFSTPGSYAFWMKDMQFALDMVWIDSSKKVVGVTSNIPADSYPQTYLPPSPVSYVLELNAGAAQKFGIATSSRLVF